jgi:hypothetical protein
MSVTIQIYEWTSTVFRDEREQIRDDSEKISIDQQKILDDWEKISYDQKREGDKALKIPERHTPASSAVSHFRDIH